jgi:Concanavalin A-like lectin/glucanases superfamily
MIANRTLSMTLLGLLAASGCSSDDSGSTGGGAGTGGSGGSSVAAVAGGSGTGGAATGGSGGGSAGTAASDGGGNAGRGGVASGASDDGGKDASKNAGDGSTSCLGRAVSFNANTGQGNDTAKARVEIDFGTSTDLPTGNAQRTIEFWAYVLTSSWSGDTNTMFFYGTNNRVADGFGLDFGGVKGTIDPFTNAIFDNDDQPTGLDATKDQWIHFAMTWDGTAVRAFVNGVEKATKASSVAQKTLMTGRTPLIIAAYPSNYFNGSIDELRIWNVARSAADITSMMNKTLVGNESGLVGYWKFDETSGAMAADSVTTLGHTAHPGTLMAISAAQLPTWVPGAPLSCP